MIKFSFGILISHRWGHSKQYLILVGLKVGKFPLYFIYVSYLAFNGGFMFFNFLAEDWLFTFSDGRSLVAVARTEPMFKVLP